MTHTASHIIISSLKTPTKGGKFPVYYYVAGACLLCFALGYLAAS